MGLEWARLECSLYLDKLLGLYKVDLFSPVYLQEVLQVVHLNPVHGVLVGDREGPWGGIDNRKSVLLALDLTEN